MKKSKFVSKLTSKVTKKGVLQMVALITVFSAIVVSCKGLLYYFRPDLDEDYDEETYQKDREELNERNGIDN